VGRYVILDKTSKIYQNIELSYNWRDFKDKKFEANRSLREKRLDDAKTIRNRLIAEKHQKKVMLLKKYVFTIKFRWDLYRKKRDEQRKIANMANFRVYCLDYQKEDF
jgi:hypothetical protein